MATVVFQGNREQAREIVRKAIFNFTHNQSEPEVQEIYVRIAQAFKEKTRSEYIHKARGGTDASGQRWKPHKRFELGKQDLMIATGDLLRSLDFKIENGSVSFEFNVDYAKYALKHRPAWPDDGDLPQEWWDVILNEVVSGLIDLIRKRLSR